MTEYASHVFDLDGVLLATNVLKADAFRRAGESYGREPAAAFVDLHKSAGSISRRERVERFLTETLGKPEATEDEVERLLRVIKATLIEGYETASEVDGATEYLSQLNYEDTRIVAVSGVDEAEVRTIVESRAMGVAFGGRVYGCPPNKAERLLQLVQDGTIRLPAVYYGDTEADYEAARAAGLAFVLITADADWDWRPWAGRRRNVQAYPDFRSLLSFPPQQDMGRRRASTPAQPSSSRVRVGRDGYAEVDGERRYFGRMLRGALVRWDG